jgi:hypothetical protein
MAFLVGPSLLGSLLLTGIPVKRASPYCGIEMCAHRLFPSLSKFSMCDKKKCIPMGEKVSIGIIKIVVILKNRFGEEAGTGYF